MVNYNPDAPKERGFWYDAVISRIVSSAADSSDQHTSLNCMHCPGLVLCLSMHMCIYNLQLVDESLAIKVVDYNVCLSTSGY